MYDGVKPELRNWITQLRLKLVGNTHRYPSPLAHLIYAINRLENHALVQVQPHVKDHSTVSFGFLDELIQLLKRAFGDPDRKAVAQRKLRDLRRKHRDFHVYLADLQSVDGGETGLERRE